MSERQTFNEEEELRLALEARGRVHDCREAGCTLDPKGKTIPEEAKGQRRPKVKQRIKDLWKKYRGLEWPEE